MELKAQEHLDRQCLGSTLLEEMSVEVIMREILINQGSIARGSKAALLEAIELDAKKMIALAKESEEKLLARESERHVEVAAIADGQDHDAVFVFVAQQVDDGQDQNDEIDQGGRRQNTVDSHTSRYD